MAAPAPHDIVNAAAQAALRAMAGPIIEHSLPGRDLLVAAESVVAGALLLIVKLGGDEPALEVFTENVRERLASARLGGLEAEGQA